MWKRSENSDPLKPLAYEESGNNIIIRRNYTAVPATEEMAAHWTYDEWQMTREQYAIFAPLNAVVEEQADALIELAEIITEVV